MYCNVCGKAIPDDAQVCSYCGKQTGVLRGAVASPGLVRPRHGRRIAGVCAGLAQRFGWNVTLLRLLWLLAVLFLGTGVVAYIILWIIMPNEA